MASRRSSPPSAPNAPGEAHSRTARARPLERRARGEGSGMADRRERILAVAARRFAAAGFEATTVRQIAEDVNILSGSLYHHFATKEEMLHEIVRAPAEHLRDLATRIATLPDDAETRLATLIRADLVELTGNHELHAILYAERKFFRRNPDFAYVVAAKKQAYAAWQAILAEGARAGQFAADIDHHLAITTTIRMLNTGADWFINEDVEVLDAMVAHSLDALTDFLLKFILRAVRKPERAGAPLPVPLTV